MAGHDVLAITLRAILYFLCKNLEVQGKLRREICKATDDYDASVIVPNAVDNNIAYL